MVNMTRFLLIKQRGGLIVIKMTHSLYRCCFNLYCHIFCRFQSLLPKNSLFCLKIISFSLSLLDCCKINNGLRIWPHNDKCFTIIQSVVDVIKLVLEELYIFPKLRNWIKFVIMSEPSQKWDNNAIFKQNYTVLAVLALGEVWNLQISSIKSFITSTAGPLPQL